MIMKSAKLSVIAQTVLCADCMLAGYDVEIVEKTL